MGYILTGVAIFLLLAALGTRSLKLPTWRIGAGVAAIAAFSGAGYFGLRGVWPASLLLTVVGLWLATSARMPRRAGPQTRQSEARRQDDRMSAHQARAILGVGENATTEEIQTAYKRLMLRVHPDNGGAAGLAAQLNAARDRLLKP
jgi:hypothetical protein